MKKRIIKNKRSQVTLFIIVAIILVAVVALILLYPKIKSVIITESPDQNIENCVKGELDAGMEKIAKQGGSMNPENTILYQDNKVNYLCYTPEYYKTCVMQQPLLKQHVEQELEGYLMQTVDKCVNEMASYFEGKGYSVSVKKSGMNLEIIPHAIRLSINTPVTLTKGASQSFSGFTITRRSEMYDLIAISESMLNWEARYGDSAPETYMLYYPDLKIEKLRQGDGSKIYILADRESKEEFLFATRSLVLPAGYGVGEQFVK